MIICGLMSCRGDAYNPTEALGVDEALEFHTWQAGKLAGTGVDFLLAATLPAISEAIGLAMALAATAKPYVLSFVVRPEGTLLDGTPLKSAIAAIDAAVTPRPLAYLINCTHASFAASALMHETNSSTLVRHRIIGLLANTAALSPEELNDSSSLVEEDPEIFGQSVAALHRRLGLKILGDAAVPTTVTSGPWQHSLQFRHDKRILQRRRHREHRITRFSVMFLQPIFDILAWHDIGRLDRGR